MEKFPLRLKDDALLVTDFYSEPSGAAITAMTVFVPPASHGPFPGAPPCGPIASLTRKGLGWVAVAAADSDNFVELAYGTAAGHIRIVILHPQATGHAPTLFQTHTVHTTPICSVMLSEKYLVSGTSARRWQALGGPGAGRARRWAGLDVGQALGGHGSRGQALGGPGAGRGH